MILFLCSCTNLMLYKALLRMVWVFLLLSQAAFAEQGTDSKEKQTIKNALSEINTAFENMHVEVIKWPEEALPNLGKIKSSAFVAFHKRTTGGKRPLLISLHGGGGKSSSIVEQLTRSAKVKGLALAEKSNRDLILFEPNSSDSWDAVSLNYALALFLERYPEVDTKRIYLMGHSMGGTGTLNWAMHDPNLFAAISPSGFRLKEPITSIKSLSNVPIWLAVGSEDGVRPEDVMSVYFALKEAGNKQVGFTAFPGANHPKANAAVFGSVELVEWFLTHSKN